MMKILVWLARLLVFVALFLLALNNSSEVTLRLLMGYTWHAPLILMLLVFFLIGALFGMLALLPRYMRLRKQRQQGPVSPEKVSSVSTPDSRFRTWNR